MGGLELALVLLVVHRAVKCSTVSGRRFPSPKQNYQRGKSMRFSASSPLNTEAVTTTCLKRIVATLPRIFADAWGLVPPAWVHRMGRAVDGLRKASRSLGDLHSFRLSCATEGPSESRLRCSSEKRCQRRARTLNLTVGLRTSMVAKRRPGSRSSASSCSTLSLQRKCCCLPEHAGACLRPVGKVWSSPSAAPCPDSPPTVAGVTRKLLGRFGF